MRLVFIILFKIYWMFHDIQCTGFFCYIIQFASTHLKRFVNHSEHHFIGIILVKFNTFSPFTFDTHFWILELLSINRLFFAFMITCFDSSQCLSPLRRSFWYSMNVIVLCLLFNGDQTIDMMNNGDTGLVNRSLFALFAFISFYVVFF